MSDFAGMEELLQDFLTEANELLSDVDNKLLSLERHPDDAGLLNDVFRGFHTIKGGAGFLNVEELVKLCHLTENLFDRLRNRELSLNAEVMDVILSATMTVREMFSYLERGAMPPKAEQALLDTLQCALDGKLTGTASPRSTTRRNRMSRPRPGSRQPQASTAATDLTGNFSTTHCLADSPGSHRPTRPARPRRGPPPPLWCARFRNDRPGAAPVTSRTPSRSGPGVARPTRSRCRRKPPYGSTPAVSTRS